MKHQSFALIDKKDYNGAFDLPYKDLVITYEPSAIHGHETKEYCNYYIEVNHLTQHTGKIDYDAARELFAMAWGGKVKEEDAAKRMRDKIMDYLRSYITQDLNVSRHIGVNIIPAIMKLRID